MKKVLVSALGLVLVLVIGGFVYLYLNLNGLIKDGVNEFAPKYTQTPVNLGGASVSILSGEGSLSNLVVGNPKGYKGDEAFRLGDISVALNTDTLTADTIVIRSIDIAAPEINYEPGGAAGSNLQQLVQNIQRTAGGQSKSGGDERGAGKKLIIDRLTIRDGKLKITTPLSKEPLAAGLPTIELTDIGRNKGGTSAGEVFRMVVGKVSGAATQVGNLSIKELQSQLGGKVEEAVGGIKDKVKVPEGIGGAAGEAGEKLKGLFK